MSSYATLFKLRMSAGLQYRGAALSGIVTQLAWGFLLITLFQLLGNQTMTSESIATYFWLNQAFISLNAIWTMDPSIFEDIDSGDIQYSLIRPQSIYLQLFVRNGAHRLSRTILRSVPLLLMVFLLPEPYTMHLPTDFVCFVAFVVSLSLSLLTQLSIGNIMVALIMKTKHSLGVRTVFASAFDFLDGGNIPYVFFPSVLQKILRATFFYSIKSAPFLIYMGLIPIMETILLQLLWVLILIGVGYHMIRLELRKIEVFGG